MKTLALIAYYSFAWFLPGAPVPGYRISYAVRRFLARRFVAECGRDVEIKAKAYLGRGTGIRLGDGCRVGKNAVLNASVTIGRNTLIGPDVMIFTLNHRFEDREMPVRDQGYKQVAPVVLGDDVWIAARVVILPGVRVGEGAIVGAGSVVPKDVPAWAIVAGNPARIIGWRGGKPGDIGDAARTS